MQFSNTYLTLNERFYQRINPQPVSAPLLLLWNDALANQLQFDADLAANTQELAQLFSGNKLLEGSQPIALAYCGHQFGQLNPNLGDGRAHLLGEVLDEKGRRVDIQLKGSGPTQYSRNGDGRSALGPALREYIMSEAMFYLGVPTTRSLAVVATGDQVYRQTIQPGGITTRVASSHIRVGTFVYFAVHRDHESLSALLDYSIERHYPQLSDAGNKALAFLQAVMDKQIALIVQWMRVGFIHGVMNTDNCAISGETIDYGPCAMMGAYDASAVFSSIDVQGRYAFGNQASIALWNMTRLAESLITLIDTNEKTAVSLAQDVLETFVASYEHQFKMMMLNKLGLHESTAVDSEFIEQLLTGMTEKSLDYTQCFIDLQSSLTDAAKAVSLLEILGDWYRQWRELIGETPQQLQQAEKIMAKANPLVIPRNHHVEATLKACENEHDTSLALRFLAVLKQPYQQLENTADFQDSSNEYDSHYKTFCGT